MEKKTLGKFIATLRKERGMTQKELGEKLFVTDKTVSRWECDESAPELSLLPVIAELFGVTTDELLRGERKTSEREEAKETSPKQSEERGEKYFRQLLRRQKKRFIEFSLLSVGLTATGVIVAAICNFCFYRASLGFCLACVFFVAAAICQLIFTLNGRLPIEDAESATRRAEMQRINSEIVLCSVRVFCGIFCALSACVPLAMLPSSYYGLPFGSCLLAAVLFCAVGFFVAFVVYRLFVEELLVKKQVIFLGTEKNALREKRRKLLKRVVCVFCAVCLFLFAGAAVVSVLDENGAFLKKTEFDDVASFIEYVEKDCDEWYRAAYGALPEDGFKESEFERRVNWDEIDGQTYYYRRDLYRILQATKRSDTGEYVLYVITEEAYGAAQDTVSILYAISGIGALINLAACTIWYGIGARKKER